MLKIVTLPLPLFTDTTYVRHSQCNHTDDGHTSLKKYLQQQFHYNATSGIACDGPEENCRGCMLLACHYRFTVR